MIEVSKPTAGPWTYLEGTRDCEKVIAGDGKIVADCWWSREASEVDANSRLIAEAGSVHHETGLTPRQLVEKRDLLEAALSEMCEFFAPNAWGSADNRRDALNNAEAALALVKGEPK